jgi:hypothetical protein
MAAVTSPVDGTGAIMVSCSCSSEIFRLSCNHLDIISRFPHIENGEMMILTNRVRARPDATPPFDSLTPI